MNAAMLYESPQILWEGITIEIEHWKPAFRDECRIRQWSHFGSTPKIMPLQKIATGL